MPEMPNIVIFKETILPRSETFILAQMRALKRFTPYLVGLERTAASLPLEQAPILLSSHISKASDVRAKLYRRSGIAPAFHNRVRHLQPALMHAHFASGGKTLIPLQQSLRLPLVVTLHGGSCVPVQAPRRGVYDKLAEKASLFLCVSEFVRRQALEAGFPADKLVVHYIGIDRALFQPRVDSVTTEAVLFIGRLVEMKGCEYLIRAMRLVQMSRAASELTIIGDGPLRPQLESLASELGVRCRFLGVQPAATIRHMLQDYRMLCLPSVTTADGHVEGLGMVLLEAQAMGLPVVATRHAGIAEAVADDVTGILVTERDSEQLANAILRLLNDGDLWQRYHLATRAHIERRFDLEKQTALLEDLYTEQISRGTVR
jgi:glycosyltransferase involved in cell wall biosynthesis